MLSIVKIKIVLIMYISGKCVGTQYMKFEDDFVFGAATSAYQIEGAWNVSDKGPSVWDVFIHEQPEKVNDLTNGDFSTNSYHLYEKDIALLKELGVTAYRFSIAWSRLLPTGFIYKKSKDGLRYYNNLINKLLENGIEPYVTLYHWDIPEPLQRLGGFTSRFIIEHFVDYAGYAFEQFGDRVKYWITFNEININCVAGYAKGVFAPGLEMPGHGEYLCAHNMLLAHGHTYRMYKSRFADSQKGKIGMAPHFMGYYPFSNNARDVEIANLAFEYYSGWILNPIYSSEGDYPEELKNLIRKNSLQANYSRSRLPSFTKEEITLLRGSADFLGVNHYVSTVFTETPPDDSNLTSLIEVFPISDLPYYPCRLNKWPYQDIPLYTIVPEGFRDVLTKIALKYDSPVMYITENGFPNADSSADLNDFSRVDYMNQYLTAVLQAKDLGADIRGYFQWSLMDNFEWSAGYQTKFGIFAVDFNSPTRNRTAKLSSRVYKNIIKTKRVDANYLPIIQNDAFVV